MILNAHKYRAKINILENESQHSLVFCVIENKLHIALSLTIALIILYIFNHSCDICNYLNIYKIFKK